VSQKTTLLWLADNLDLHQPMLIIFGKNVSKKVRSQPVLYFPTSPN